MRLCKINLAVFLGLFIFLGAAHASPLIEYITDLEGDYARFESYLQKSEIFTKDAAGKLVLKPGAYFVYGGDTIDRFSGGQKMLDTLLDLKERYPTKVVLILGNRDLTKMPLLKIAYTYEADHNIQAATAALKEHLKFMHVEKSFEYLRTELSEKRGVPVSDKDVTKAFFQDIKPPEGRIYKYMSYGEIGHVIDGNLFTHSRINLSNLREVPGQIEKNSNPITAIRKVNEWKNKQLASWARDGEGGKALYQYQFPEPKSLVNSRYVDEFINQMPLEEDLVKQLTAAGIHRNISGHTPAGESPLILRKPNYEMVVGDLSYSEGHDGPLIQMRGEKLHIVTTLADGNKIEVNTELNKSTLLGLRTKDGYTVTGRYENGDYLRVRYGAGFKLDMKRSSEQEILGLLPKSCADSFQSLGK